MKNRNLISFAGISSIALFASPVLADEHAPQHRTETNQRDRADAAATVVGGRIVEPDWSKLRSSSDLVGQDLKTADEQDTIGSISDVYVDFGSGSIPGVVVSTGGFLGIGERHSLISMDSLELIDDSDDFKASFTKEQVESAPEVDMDRTPDFAATRPLGARTTNSGLNSGRTPGVTPDATRNASRSTGQIVLLSDLEGMDVMNREDEKIGSVEQVYIDLGQQQVIGAVVSTGGFLGMGEHETLLSFRELQYDGSEEVIRVNLTKTDLEEAPEYDSGEANLGERLSDRWEALRANMDTDFSVLDQGMGRSDIETTASIRRELRGQEELSTRAHNVTIITKDGQVTVRGEVDSEEEKGAVERIAKSKAGENEVNLELTVNRR